MGERKGTNKYYPPDYDPKRGGLNKFQGVHALRERARKLHLGILIIRFEMPFNIWCDGCGNHIGTGVRYNAEKTKIGMYYTTPIYQFKMKCHLCENRFEIKTDPANLDYVIVSGARRQERRWDPKQNGQIVPEDKATIQKLYQDPMFQLQHSLQDRKSTDKRAMEKLSRIQDRVKDDYLANKILRDSMRSVRRAAEAQGLVDDALRSKASIDIPLLPENERDIKTASLLMNSVKTLEEPKGTCESVFDKPTRNKPDLGVVIKTKKKEMKSLVSDYDSD